MGAQKSRLDKAGGNYDAAVASLLAEKHPDVEAMKAQLASPDPAIRAQGQAALDRKIRQSTKGKYSGVLGTIAKGVKTVAPLAAAFVPGVGPLAAAGIAAGTRVAGDALSGERINVGQAALSGLGAYGIKSLGGGAGASTGGKAGVEAIGKVAAQPGGPGGGILGNVGGGILDFIKADPERAIRLGLGGLGAIQGAQAAGRAEDLQRRALAPLYGNSVNPYASMPADTGNPYAQQYRRPQGQSSLNAALSR